MAATKSGPASIADVLAQASKKYDLKVGSLTSVASDVKAISTGNLAIDHIIGVGGIPLGRSVELYGPPSSGKTTTALQSAAELQRIIKAGGDPVRGIGPDDYIAYFDYEQAMDPTYVKKLGLDVEHPSFLFAQPDDLEQGANVARSLIATGKVRMTVWDSVAAMTPAAALEAETGKASVAMQARLMSDFLKVMNPLLKNNNCTAVFLNHIMEVLDMGGARRPGMPARTSTPGGRALKFYASVRVEYQQIGNIKSKVTDDLTQEETEQVTATNVRVRVIKNKVAPPFRQAIVRVRYGKGFDNFWTAMQVLVAHKQLVYSSGYHYFERSPHLVPEWMPRQASGSKRPYLRGEEALFSAAEQHPEWARQVIAAAETVIADDPDALNAVTETVEVEPDAEESQDPAEDTNLTEGPSSDELDALIPPSAASQAGRAASGDMTASLLADL